MERYLRIEENERAEERYVKDMYSRIYSDRNLEKNIEKWIDFLKWQENVEKENLTGIFYKEFKIENGKIIFYVKANSEKEIRKIEKFLKDESIEIYPLRYSVSKEVFRYSGSEFIRGIPLGKYENIELVKDKEYKIIFEASPLASEEMIQDEGILSTSIYGTLNLIERESDALERVSNNNSENKNMGEWLFDGSKADSTLRNDEIIEYLTKRKLNDKQKKAIEGIVNSKEIFLIQGPPGTGKTTVISEGIYQLVKKGQRILISSQTNLAVDNVLEKLDIDSAIRSIRFGRADKISNEAKKFTEECILNEYYNSIIFCVEEELSKKKDISEKVKLEEIKKHLDEIAKLDFEKKYIDITEKIVEVDEELKRIRNSKQEMVLIEDLMRKWIEHLEMVKDTEEEKKKFKKTYLKNCNVVGISCTATLRELKEYDLKTFDVVIIDEVSKAILPEIVLSSENAKRVVLVGDQNQLSPIWKYRKNELPLELQEKCEEMEKLIKEDVFEKYYSECNENLKIMLDTQYRMEEDIQEVINYFYKNELKCGKEKSGFKEERRVVWKNSYKDKLGKIAFEVRPIDSTSKFNENEILMIEEEIVQLDQYLEKKYKVTKKVNVGVISFYLEQVNRLRNKLNRIRFKCINVEINTVDSFQGKEKDIIFVSLVTNPNGNSVSEHMKNFKRINVAFSRAKEFLCIFGAIEVCSDIDVTINGKKEKVYGNIINNLKRKNSCLEINEKIWCGDR